MGGSPGMMADLAGRVAADNGGKASTGNFQYTPPPASANGKYVPQYQPISPTPFLQSVLTQQNPSLSGLSNLYGNLFGNQQPVGIQQLAPMTPYTGSTYRPNMAAVRQNLNNVAPSVQEQQRLQAIEDARIRAEQEAYDAAHPQPTYQDYGGGG